MKTVTIADVAKRAKASKSTVSQYLNKRFDYMGEKTRERIQKAIDELEYQPNIVARSLKQKSTSTIGVIVANILHSFSTHIIRVIEDVCHEQGFHIIVCNADDEPEKEKNYINMLRAKQVDGLIIFPTGGNIELYEKMFNENYPLVFVDRTVPDLPVRSVMLDNHMASQLAIEHFVNRGYERIGIITTSIIRNITPRVERLEGYKKSLQTYQLEMNPDYIKTLALDQIQSGVKEMLSLEKPPQCILAANDLSLMEVLKSLKDNNVSIPEDIALIGIDDVSFASFYHPGLTTVAQPTFDMGQKAVELLLSQIKKEDLNGEPYIFRFDPKLIVRHSC